MFEAEASYNRSILDYLNEDCWRIVLDYVPILDIIRTERTNRRWQRAVLIYLQGFRFRITSPKEESSEQKLIRSCIESPFSSCNLRLFRYSVSHKYYESFASWLNKLGSLVVATYCWDLESLQKIKAKCPNLESLTLLHMYDYDQPFKPPSRVKLIPNCLKDFKNLKRLSFYGSYLSDDIFSLSIGERTLEELEFHSCYNVTGQCLNTIKKTKLKSLVFDICNNLQSEYISTYINHLQELTKLVLNYVPGEVCYNIQLMLDKMNQLEWLEINEGFGCRYSQAAINQADSLHFEPVSTLSRLKYLSIGLLVTNNAIQTVTVCCNNLRSLELSNCVELSSQALEVICHNAGMHLARLRLHAFESLNDDDVVACARRCPKLIYLSVNGQLLTDALPARVEDARHELRLGQDLQLVISCTDPIHGQEMYV